MEENPLNINTQFEKILKLNDDLENSDGNIIKILENSNMKIGTGSRVNNKLFLIHLQRSGNVLNSIRMPFFYKQFSQGIVLAKYFIRQSQEGNINLKGKNILELGCGTGVLSIVLASLGANVICSDLPELKEVVEDNIKINQELIQKNNGKIEFIVLDWYSSEEEITKTLLNQKLEKIDFIVGADVIFNEKQLKFFPKTLKLIYTTIKKIQTRSPLTYLSHKSRHDEIDDQLPKEFEFYEFFGEEIDPQEMDPNYMSNRIAIFRFDL